MTKLSNKRKNQRFGCVVPVESKSGTIFENSQTVDISSSGIGLIFQKEIALSKKIAIEIALAPQGESILVIGQVQWRRPLEFSSGFRVGMKFSDVLSGSRSRLDKYFRE